MPRGGEALDMDNEDAENTEDAELLSFEKRKLSRDEELEPDVEDNAQKKDVSSYEMDDIDNTTSDRKKSDKEKTIEKRQE